MIPPSVLLCAFGIVTNAVELAHPKPDVRFDLTGTVTFAGTGFGTSVALEDESGAISIANETSEPHIDVQPGDRVQIWGVGDVTAGGLQAVRLNGKGLKVLSRGPAPKPRETTIRDLQDGKHDFRLVRFPCVLRDIFADEIDAGYLFLTLSDGDETITAAIQRTSTNETRFATLVGATLDVTALCYPDPSSSTGRCYLGRRLSVGKLETAFVVRQVPGRNPFDLPGIGELSSLSPARIARHGRCRAVGTVLAVWNGNRALLRDKIGREFSATFASPPAPRCGEFVEVAGLPATDLYHINLLRAIWRKTPGKPVACDTATSASVASLFTDKLGQNAFQPQKHAQLLRLTGTVKAIDTKEHASARLYLEDSGHVLPVDFSSAVRSVEGLVAGCRVELTGVCVMEGDDWTPYTPFPQLRSALLVLRSPADVRVLSRPSWWTAGRLLAVLGIVLAVLGGILAWNFLLRSAVRKRERELKREIFARVNSDMKMRERQNLSIELHDSLSQGLTGVSMEIDTAKRLTDSPDELNRHLGLAASSLKACRDELRTCIYDLRNNALGDCDMNESIRRTLAPFVGNVDLQIRFNVPRERLTDNVAHNLLRIVRELVVNAVNHGHATTIKVAGTLEGSQLNFSVRDNGRGFDPNACPGMAQGHFGIQGIRERLKRLNGSLSYDSAPNTGTKAVVTIAMPEDEDAEDA